MDNKFGTVSGKAFEQWETTKPMTCIDTRGNALTPSAAKLTLLKLYQVAVVNSQQSALIDDSGARVFVWSDQFSKGTPATLVHDLEEELLENMIKLQRLGYGTPKNVNIEMERLKMLMACARRVSEL